MENFVRAQLYCKQLGLTAGPWSVLTTAALLPSVRECVACAAGQPATGPERQFMTSLGNRTVTG